MSQVGQWELSPALLVQRHRGCRLGKQRTEGQRRMKLLIALLSRFFVWTNWVALDICCPFAFSFWMNVCVEGRKRNDLRNVRINTNGRLWVGISGQWYFISLFKCWLWGRTLKQWGAFYFLQEAKFVIGKQWLLSWHQCGGWCHEEWGGTLGRPNVSSRPHLLYLWPQAGSTGLLGFTLPICKMKSYHVPHGGVEKINKIVYTRCQALSSPNCLFLPCFYFILTLQTIYINSWLRTWTKAPCKDLAQRRRTKWPSRGSL